jgi:N-acetyl sugar amidotransferase
MTIKYCKKCLFPDSKPDLYFDSTGVCDACRTAERKHGHTDSIDWDSRAIKFEKILSSARKKADGWYDCIVPVSGGKDSIWQAYAMKKIHNMNPLVITFDQFDQTETGRHNLDVLREIGVDHVHFTLNPNVVRILVKKGFEIIGDPYWVNHVGIFTVPFHFATRFKIPLVIFGENPQFEYGGPESSRDNMLMDKRWRQEFGGMRGLREEDMVDLNISIEDLRALQYPTDEMIYDSEVLGTFYGHYFKWDANVHTEKMKKIGWTPLPKAPAGSWVDYENCDMRYIDIREHIKYLKYGYGRATDQLNIELRHGRITRDKALSIALKIDGKVDPDNVIKFCEYLGISTNKYNSIVDSFVNTDLFRKSLDGSWVLKDERI